MSNTKHTEGPWIAGECGIPDEPGVFSDGLLVAKVPVPLNLCRSEAEANARLIASAPELLAALKGMVWAFEKLGNGKHIQAARAAIAAAEATQ